MKYFYLLAITLFCSCQVDNTLTNQNKQEIRDAISAVMDKQSTDWSDGNIDDFMEGYWKSDSLRFVGSRGITYGWNKTKSNYKKSYPDREAMGELKFDINNVDILTPQDAILLGGFTLYRSSDTLSGNFTLTWKNIEDNWLITSDMTCG